MKEYIWIKKYLAAFVRYFFLKEFREKVSLCLRIRVDIMGVGDGK